MVGTIVVGIVGTKLICYPIIMPRTRISVDAAEPDPKTSVAPAVPLEKEESAKEESAKEESATVIAEAESVSSLIKNSSDPVGAEEKGEAVEKGKEEGKEQKKEEELTATELKIQRDPRFPAETTTDEDLRNISGKTPLSTFLAFPQNVHFAGELPGEDIVLILRAHLITTVPWIVLTVLGTLLPFVLIPLITVTGLIPFAFANFVFFITVLWYMGLFSYAFLKILFWYFNVGIITNERVVDVDWHTLTSHDVTNTRISKFEDVKSVRNGVLQGLFDYGTVYAQTAGEERNVEFDNTAHPDLVVRKLQELMQIQEEEAEN